MPEHPPTNISIVLEGETLFTVLLGRGGKADCILDRDDLGVLRIFHDSESCLMAENISNGELIALNDKPLGSPTPLRDGDTIDLMGDVYTLLIEDLEPALQPAEAASEKSVTSPSPPARINAPPQPPPGEGESGRKLITPISIRGLLLAGVFILAAVWIAMHANRQHPTVSGEPSPSLAIASDPQPSPPEARPAVAPAPPAPTIPSPSFDMRETDPSLAEPLSPDGQADRQESLVWRVDAGSEAGCLALLPEGLEALVGNGAGQILRMDTTDGEILAKQDAHASSVSALALSPAARLLVSGSYDQTAKVWDLDNGYLLHTLDAHTSPVRAVAVSADTTRAATADTEGMIMLWNLTTGEDIRWFLGHVGMVNALAFSPDGRFLYSGGVDQTLRCWNVADGKPVYTTGQAGGGINAVALTSDGSRILTGSDNFLPSPDGPVPTDAQTLRAWNAEDGSPIPLFSTCNDWILGIDIAEDGSTVTTATGGNPVNPGLNTDPAPAIRTWDLRTGLPVQTLTGHTDTITAVANLPDGNDVLSTSLDLTVRRWYRE